MKKIILLIIMILSITSVYGLSSIVSGDSVNYTFNNCSQEFNLKITGENIIQPNEYTIIGCNKTTKDFYRCQCNFTLLTVVNTLNTYNLTKLNVSSHVVIVDTRDIKSTFDNVSVSIPGIAAGEIVTGTKTVTIKATKNNTNKTIIEFNFNFDNDNLDLSNLTVEENNATYGGMFIKGITLPVGQTKTIYLDNKNNKEYVCIKDSIINNISELPNVDCSDGVKVKCDGGAGTYTCTKIAGQYKITGLSHSAVIESTYVAPPVPVYNGGSPQGERGYITHPNNTINNVTYEPIVEQNNSIIEDNEETTNINNEDNITNKPVVIANKDVNTTPVKPKKSMFFPILILVIVVSIIGYKYFEIKKQPKIK